MIYRLVLASLLFAGVTIAAPAVEAAAKKCPPGSYWSGADGKCIYGNGR